MKRESLGPLSERFRNVPTTVNSVFPEDLALFDRLSSGTGVPQLATAQVIDGFTDVLTGDAGLEQFFRGPGDTLQGKVAAETAISVA